MTSIGKLSVLLNLGLSLMMAVAALALWSTGIDWRDTGPKGNQPAGRLFVVKKEIDTLKFAWTPVERSWALAWAGQKGPKTESEVGLLQLEEQRRDHLKWYAAELQHLRTTATERAAGRVVARMKGQLPEPDPANANRPRMEPALDRAGAPLQSLIFYNAERIKARNGNLLVIDDLNTQIAEHIKLTNLINGLEGKTKGLRRQITEERIKRDGIEAETNLTQPLFINTRVESELVQKRYESMQERIKELKDHLRRRYKVEVDGKDG